MKLLVATSNPGKLVEIREILAGLALELLITPGLAIWREGLERKCREERAKCSEAASAAVQQEAR